MTLASLPTLDCYIAFDPTASSTTLLSASGQALPASGASNSYWTNVSIFVKDFQTKSGRQHFLDRVESSTIQMTLNGTTGYFLNGNAPSGSRGDYGYVDGNGTGFVLSPRMPIAVTATWSGTTYPVYWGITESITERITDQLNVDLILQASDYIKYLSLRYMSIPSFWAGYVTNAASAADWYRCTTNFTGVVTNAVGNGTTVTYTAQHDFSAGDNVTISGLGISSGVTLNLVNVTLATVSSSGFTVTDSSVGQSVGQGAAYRTRITDLIGSNHGSYLGTVAFPQYGAVIYDLDGCVDLANGGSLSTGNIRLPAFNTLRGGIDFWILGQGLATTTSILLSVTSSTHTVILAVTPTGKLQCTVSGIGGSVDSGVKIDDGYWHHIGLVDNGSGVLQLYCDGQFFSLASLTSLGGWTQATNLFIGAFGTLFNTPMYVDEIVISDRSSLSTLENEVKNRWIAGSMLQQPTNRTQATVQSGDRIAQILCLAGFGHITAGAIVLFSNLYFINNGSAWVNATSGNGYIHVEPYYWDTPVTGSTALDLILQICDTDIGIFFQKPDGTFAFFNQSFYGSWVGPPTNTWTPSYSPPAGDHIWSDVVSPSDIAALVTPYYGPSLQVVRDDADVWTTVKITPQAGVEQIYENTSAEARWGYTTLTKSGTVPPTLKDALSAATFLGHLFRSPLPRVQNVELRAETAHGGTMTALFDCYIGDPVTFKRTSPNASTSGTYPDVKGQISADMTVESIMHDFQADPGQWHVSFQLDPYILRA